MSLFHHDSHIAKNIIISLDFDGVLAHGLQIKKHYAQKWFGMNLSLDQTKKEGFEALAKHLHKNINYRDLMDPLNEKHIMEYEVPSHCLSVLTKLHSEGFRFVIITSRNDHDYPYAVRFVKHKFGHLIKYIHNTRNEPKNAFVKHLRPRIHIDDGLKKLLELQNETINLCYYRQPENNHENLPLFNHQIKEIRKWQEFYKHCHHIKKLHEAICEKFDIPNNYRHQKEIYRLSTTMNHQEQEQFILRLAN